MQFFDANGNPLAGGLLYTYAAGTVNPLVTYTDFGAFTPNSNPIVLDSRGEASVWVADSDYYFELKNSSGSLQWTADNISAGLTTLQIHNSSSKLIPVDADEFVLLDSATSFSTKKTTWTNIKSTIAAIYSAVSGSTLVGDNTGGVLWTTVQGAIAWLYNFTSVTVPTNYLQIANLPQTQNILPNTNWQLWSLLTKQTKVKADGSGAQTVISCTGFTINNNTPTFTTTNTQELKVGDLVEITGGGFYWNYSGVVGAPPTTCVRIAGIVANISFIVRAPFGGVSPAISVAVTATPTVPSNTGLLVNGQSADGWSQATTLSTWPDDFASNSYAGSIRAMGIRKGIIAEENVYFTVAENDIYRYRGRTLTYGINVNQTIQSGAGTWRIGIYDNVNGWRYSASGTGVSLGAYQFLSVTAPISASATIIYVSLFLSGTTNDVYYHALPTCVVGSYLSQENCGQNINETIRAGNHWNPPMMTPLAITISAAYSLGAGLYGFLAQDLEALSMGQCHKSIHAVKAKIELTTPTVGALLLTSTGFNTMTTTTFGPEVGTQVANVVNVGQGMLPLSPDGTFSIYTNTSGLVITNATFDFDTVVLSSSEISN